MNHAAVSVSVAFNDNSTRRLFEAEAMDTEKRIEAAVFSKEHNYWARLRDNLMALKNDRQLNLNIHL